MDEAKVSFLFGEVPDGYDVDDPDDRAALLDAGDGGGGVDAFRAALRSIVAEQVASDDPPLVWETVQRLLGLGLGRQAVLSQLAMVLTSVLSSHLAAGGGSFDRTAYEDALRALPLPTREEVESLALELVRSNAAEGIDELEDLVLDRLDRSEDELAAVRIVERVVEGMLDNGPLALLAGDRFVDVPRLTSGIVLTHRLSADERERDTLTIAFDLAGFQRREDLRLLDGHELTPFGGGRHRAWAGPPGWLDASDPGSVLAVRVDDDGLVHVARSGASGEARPDDGLVTLLRSVYDDEVAELGMPVTGEDLVLGMLARDPGAFHREQPPLDELCAAAGLERRGHEVAHDEEIWARQRKVRQLHRVFTTLERDDQRDAATRALELAGEADPAAADLTRALADLRDPLVAEVVVEELLAEGTAASFSQALLDAATTGRQVGVARWVAALVAEDHGEVLVADAHLRLALEADPSSGPVIERCAWYASDRGDAREAVRLWRQLTGDHSADLDLVEPFVSLATPKLGRNHPCWCGSGRKSKACHPRQAPPVPLPDRVGWLCRKAVAYVEHGGSEARESVLNLAAARAIDGEPGSLGEAIDDPVVMDALLTEGGWFESFVEDRGPLLPDDEAMLARAWTLVARTVYEVTGVDEGVGLVVRDLRTGDELTVRERTYSRQARSGTFLCGRAVPDGETHQFVGRLFPVAPGSEPYVLELCDEDDAEAVCEHVRSLYLPPELRTREGEELVDCRAVLEVPSGPEAAGALDRLYRRDGDRWIELFEIGPGDDVLRATLQLDGTRLEVSTHSEERIDRVLDVLREALPGLRVVRDRRKPLAFDEMPVDPAHAGEPEAVLPDQATASRLQDLFERRWLDEAVPALGGLTPRQAADDPTRRDELRRLIASFPDAGDLDPAVVTMRPPRLLELLGLDE